MRDEVNRIDGLREAVRAYGETAIKTHELLKPVGLAIFAHLNRHLHRDKTLVRAVPPEGPFDPEGFYNDQAFSSYEGGFTLAPLAIGLAVRVDNLADDGALWIRLPLTLMRRGDRVRLAVGNQQITDVPIDGYEQHLDQACIEIQEYMLSLFTDDVALDTGGLYGRDAAIGFCATRTRAFR